MCHRLQSDFSISVMCEQISVEAAEVGVESYGLFAFHATLGILNAALTFLSFHTSRDPTDTFCSTPKFAVRLKLSSVVFLFVFSNMAVLYLFTLPEVGIVFWAGQHASGAEHVKVSLAPRRAAAGNKYLGSNCLPTLLMCKKSWTYFCLNIYVTT